MWVTIVIGQRAIAGLKGARSRSNGDKIMFKVKVKVPDQMFDMDWSIKGNSLHVYCFRFFNLTISALLYTPVSIYQSMNNKVAPHNAWSLSISL